MSVSAESAPKKFSQLAAKCRNRYLLTPGRGRFKGYFPSAVLGRNRPILLDAALATVACRPVEVYYISLSCSAGALRVIFLSPVSGGNRTIADNDHPSPVARLIIIE